MCYCNSWEILLNLNEFKKIEPSSEIAIETKGFGKITSKNNLIIRTWGDLKRFIETNSKLLEERTVIFSYRGKNHAEAIKIVAVKRGKFIHEENVEIKDIPTKINHLIKEGYDTISRALSDEEIAPQYYY